MPQRTCCVRSCKSTLLEGAVLHTFPNPSTEHDKFLKWVTNAGLLGEDEDYIFRNRRICHQHFEKNYHYPKNRLSKIAVPTLNFPGIPEESVSVLGNILPEPSTSRNVSASGNVLPKPSTSRNVNFKTYRSEPFHYYSDEIELFKTIAKTQRDLKRSKEAKNRMAQQLTILKKMVHSNAYTIVTKHLSPAAKIFFDMQIKQGHKNPKGHRFTIDEKILALSLYKPSPKAYRLLSKICLLPNKSTLNKLMAKICLMPGSNDVIFEHLKKRVDRMSNIHKYCTLIFDEMSISANIQYDKVEDKIKGFCDDGVERKKSFSDHVMVFMVRGIMKKYKQPVAYSFCTGSTKTISLKQQLITIIRKVLSTGLKICATVSDQGTTNMAAINGLINITKANYIREGKEFRGGFYEVDGVQIHHIYDPPHLLKGIRNNLLTKDLEYIIDGRKRTAKWSHIEALYKKGPGFKGMRLVPKLTARHAIPNLIPKMKVKYCTQVFSKTVSVAMGFTAGTGRIPRECKDTAELLLFFDKLFDSVNGNYNKIENGKFYRAAVSPKSPHHKLWNKSIPILKTMKFVSRRVGMVPSISSWIKTLEAFQQITKKLHNEGLRSLLLRNFNQDPLENFFGSIRAHGQRNIMPSTIAFEASYKTLLINNMISPKSVGANCEIDNLTCLQSLKYFLTQNIAMPLPEEIIINEEHLSIELTDINLMIQSELPRDVEKLAAAAYCSGWIIKIIKRHCTNCLTCKNDLEGDSEATYSKYISLKKNSSKCVLHYPSKKMLECLLHIEIITLRILTDSCESKEIKKYIELIVTSLVSLNFVSCQTHGEKIKQIIINKGILLILNDWCRDINNLLCGKNTVYDINDALKEKAFRYFVKHKSKK